MAATLRIASERQAYTLTDRATFTQLAHTLMLKPLFQDDPDLLNTYAVIVPHDTGRGRDALRFMTWITDGDGRALISSYTIGGTHMFFVWPAGRPREAPDALPR
jgi:tungstate transport system substrate-binding protein